MIIALYITVAVIGCREPLFRLAKQKLSQIRSRRVLRVIRHFVLPLSRRCFGASVGDGFCRNTQDRWPLHRPFHPVLALFLFWLSPGSQRLNTTADIPRATREDDMRHGIVIQASNRQT